MNINKIFIVASSTLSKKTKEIEKIKDILGKKLVGIFDRCKEHSPIENVLECAKEVKKANPDIILTIGGGTPIDTVKVVQLCITLDIDSAEELKKYLEICKILHQKLDRLLFQLHYLEESIL